MEWLVYFALQIIAMITGGVAARDWKRGNAFWAGWVAVGALVSAAVAVIYLVREVL